MNCYNIIIVIPLVIIVTAEHIYRVDPLALLSGTLRTYQRAACDGDVVALRCPPGTSISVQLAQYGRSANTQALCPSPATPATPAPDPSTCLWPNALQYSLLQTVVEACQKKRQCKFHTSPKTFGGDPCPGIRKYVEVAYKCRPYEFRSKVACQNDVVQLKCNPNARIAIYSASFGRTEYESIQCPQPQGVPEETCLMSYATETVMQRCHGKRRCSLSADKATFGDPCSENSRMYLKVVYTCVPRRVLKERYEDLPEDDEILSAAALPEYDDDDLGEDLVVNVSPAPALGPAHNPAMGPEVAGTRQHGNTTDTQVKPSPNPGKSRSKPISPVPPSSRLPAFQNPTIKPSQDMQGDEDLEAINCTILVYTEKNRVIGFISQWINTYTFISNNQEKFYLYIILSVSAGLLLFLGVVIARLIVQRHRARARAKFHVSEPLPNGFADEISEIDADIDLTTTVPPPPPMAPPPGRLDRADEVVRYGNSSGIHRQDSDTNPRSLSRPGNSQYYYG